MNYQTIIVPYRNRPQHLTAFLAHMRAYIPSISPTIPDINICIVEQSDVRLFNRARLLNIGALECPSAYYIMHDIDMLPIDCHYTPSMHAEIIQFAASKIQLKDYLGGVTMFSHPVFWKSGGYNNDYFHRAEDNEMMFNLKQLRIPVLNEFYQFKQLQHKRDPNEFNAALWDKAQQKRSKQNQLLCCAYNIIHKSVDGNVMYLKVDF